LPSAPPAPPVAVARAEDMLLMLSPPTPMNWNAEPGPDGLQLQVLLFQRGRAAPVLVDGTLEFLLFEGNVAAEKVRQTKPVKTWQFSGDQLKVFQARLRAGWGYGLRLGWGPDKPSGSIITLFAQYTSESGPMAYGRMVIPMRAR
jgi:hypothetical protein